MATNRSKPSRSAKNMTPQDATSDRLRQALNAERANNALLRREIMRAQRRLAAERRDIDLIDADTKALFASLTWRLGAGIAEFIRRLTLRPRAPLVRDHIESVLENALARRGAGETGQPVLQSTQFRSVQRASSPGDELRSGPILGVSEPHQAPIQIAAFVSRRGDFSPAGSAYIRLLDPLQRLQREHAIELTLIESVNEVDDSFDCVIVQRSAISEPAKVDALRQHCDGANCALIFDIDDDLFATDFDAKDGYAAGQRQAMQKLAEVADVVTCSTPVLRERLATMNSRTEVIANGIDVERWDNGTTGFRRGRDDGPIRILYMGTRTHQKDLELFEPAWKAIKARFGDDVAFERIGVVREGKRAIGTDVKVADASPGTDRYPEFVDWISRENRWHIGIAPLTDTPFNRAKSGIKFFDYSALGLATVASNLPPYQAVIDHSVTGVLVGAEPNDWVTAISQLIEDEAMRREIGQRAEQRVRTDHTHEVSATAWLRTFQDVAMRKLTAEVLTSLKISEAAYTQINPDVGEAIARGDVRSASEHWTLLGRHEVLQGTRSYLESLALASPPARKTVPDLEANLRTWIDEQTELPLISVVVPIYRPELRWLRAAVESVTSQIYPQWELCLCDDASGQADIQAYLGSLDDPRIKLHCRATNGGIVAASNDALALANGDFVALLDHDDELTPDALTFVARAALEHNAEIIYSDEAKLELDGTVCEPHNKPSFSRELLQSQNYVSHLSVIGRSLIIEAGGFSEGVDGSQDHDLLLRCANLAERIHHIPRVLYFWRKVPESTASEFSEKSYAWEAGVKALEDVQPLGDAQRTVEKGPFPGTYRVRRSIHKPAKVSIIIPFRDQPELLDNCVRSVLERSTHQDFEIIGVDNQSAKEETHELMSSLSRADERIVFFRYDAPFNFSAINNFGARRASGDHLLLLNNDVVVDTDEWLEAMLEHSQLEDVGAVGALLLYPDRTIQHAGVILGIGGVAGHSHKYLPAEHHGYFSRPHLVQNVSAVTGACLMVKRALYASVGGLDESNLGIAFNDIDFCLRLRERGLLNVYTPYARLVHFESKSRGQEDTPDKQRRFLSETEYMRRRHALALTMGDPYYNPNLSLTHEDFRTRWE